MKPIKISTNGGHNYYVDCSILCEDDHSGTYYPAATVDALVEAANEFLARFPDESILNEIDDDGSHGGRLVSPKYAFTIAKIRQWRETLKTFLESKP